MNDALDLSRPMIIIYKPKIVFLIFSESHETNDQVFIKGRKSLYFIIIILLNILILLN